MNLTAKIEAILYASENPISVLFISEILGEDKANVSRELHKLVKAYNSRDTSLTITRIGKNYKIELKKEYNDVVVPVSQPEFSPSELEVITYIASREKCMKSDLRKRFGNRFQEPVDKFRKAHLIMARHEGRAEIFSVTRRFYSYFGITPKEIEDALKPGEGRS